MAYPDDLAIDEMMARSRDKHIMGKVTSMADFIARGAPKCGECKGPIEDPSSLICDRCMGEFAE